MKKNKSFAAAMLMLAAFAMGTGCEKIPNTESPYIEGLSINNYPVIDGSTSTLPLNTVIACELLGLEYQWKEKTEEGRINFWTMEAQIKGSLKSKFDNVIKSSQTHNSIINVIDGEADLVLSARTMSPDEKQYAKNKGVTIIETPIALDAFIFIVNPYNPITTLTTQDIQHIYTGKVTDWTNFGVEISPDYSIIHPFIRNPNSGSQELMDMLVMKDLKYYKDLPIYNEKLVFTMAGLIDAIAANPYAIGYTVYYYNEHIIRPGEKLKTIGIEGVQPSRQTISNRSYPLTTEVYAVIRSDTDRSSMAYKIYQWLQTDAGKKAIAKSGYIPN